MLQGADRGAWGAEGWRAVAYALGAFWGRLLGDATPIFAVQPLTMFATHGFLHAGLGHLLFNVLTLVSVGAGVAARAGTWRFLTLYGASMVGGGLGYAALGPADLPMVGASGALFGLVGAFVAWNAQEARRRHGAAAALRSFLWPAALLVVLNVVVFWGTAGVLAWQAHLGGFLAGSALAPLLDHRR